METRGSASSSPCALVISIPLTFFAGIGGASRAGVLVKGSNYLETLSRVSKIQEISGNGVIADVGVMILAILNAIRALRVQNL